MKNLMKCQETTRKPCHQNYCKPTGIDLFRQTSTTILQQINFTEELDKMIVQQCFHS